VACAASRVRATHATYESRERFGEEKHHQSNHPAPACGATLPIGGTAPHTDIPDLAHIRGSCGRRKPCNARRTECSTAATFLIRQRIDAALRLPIGVEVLRDQKVIVIGQRIDKLASGADRRARKPRR
jgi:hypothetical protein